MVRIHSGWLAAALALSLGSAACKKDEKAADKTATPEKSTEKPGAPSAEKGGALPSGMMPVNANADDLALLPVDSEVVMGLNFSQLSQSALWKKFVEPKLMAGDVQAKIAMFKDKCGFDPMTAVKSMSIGMKGIGGVGTPTGSLVVHGPDKAKTMACFDKAKDEAAKDGSTVTNEQGIVSIKTKTGDTFAFTFVNDSTMLGLIGPNANTAGVKAAAAASSTLKSSPAFVDMYSKINTSDSLWMLMNGNSKAFDKAAAMGFKPKAVFGSINVTDGLTVDMRMRLDTPEQATQIASMAKSQIAQAKAMFDKLDVVNEGADVKIAVGLSPAKLDALIQQVGGLIGGMAGGAPGGTGAP